MWYRRGQEGADIAPSLHEASAMPRAAIMRLMAAMFELQATIPQLRGSSPQAAGTGRQTLAIFATLITPKRPSAS
jgi:hypothetical protein